MMQLCRLAPCQEPSEIDDVTHLDAGLFILCYYECCNIESSLTFSVVVVTAMKYLDRVTQFWPITIGESLIGSLSNVSTFRY